MKATQLDHFIQLNIEAQADLEWWYQFIGPWNGVSLLSSQTVQPLFIQMHQEVGAVEHFAILTSFSSNGITD